MAYQVETESRSCAAGIDGTVYVLAESSDACRAEVWPTLGFNCFSWRLRRGETRLELLYAAPDLFNSPVPTRSGIPILFPFPNRIRDGEFAWREKAYRLPRNDPAGKNAIHGFACRRPWRVVETGAGPASAWVTAEFRSSVDADESRLLWPGNYRITVTYRLRHDSLRVEALVQNVGPELLPFGLGYHPYFHVPMIAGATERDCRIEVPARRYWELAANLPTGTCMPVDAIRDLRQPRPLAELKLDDVLTNFPDNDPSPEALLRRGRISQPAQGIAVELWTSPAFRELVVFNPPHRQAICLEPYTCTTDAINLHQRGVDAGLLLLEPGGTWFGAVEICVVQTNEPGLAERPA
ncbi:MAG TPA: aldose 1-epimerase [Gemmataceae bacterium]|nr:aldose 1-epimerase [Gemmataceae bacterium]